MYVFNYQTENNIFFDKLEERLLYWLSKYPDSFIIFGGDFNTVLDNSMDRWPSRSSDSSTSHIRLFAQRFDLTDSWRDSHPAQRAYTWCNKTDQSLAHRLLASGLSLNLNKCELLPVKACLMASIHGIPVKNSVTYLGIQITKNEQSRSSINFTPIIEKKQKILNHWLQRDLSLRGRVLLSKAEGISRLTYAAQSLHVDNTTCKSINKILHNFFMEE